jgi:hypothetical protein
LEGRHRGSRRERLASRREQEGGLGQEQAKKGEASAIREEEEGEDEDRQVDSIEGEETCPAHAGPNH